MCIHVSCDTDVEELQTMKKISQAKTREKEDLQKLFDKSNNVYNCCFIPVIHYRAFRRTRQGCN